MSDVVADTHSVIWHFTAPQNFSTAASQAMDSSEANGTIFVSSIPLVELIYLVEKGKIARDTLDLLGDALDDANSAFQLIELNRGVADELEKIPRKDVPDMPDRIISASALYLNIPLVTKDSKIQSVSLIQTIW